MNNERYADALEEHLHEVVNRTWNNANRCQSYKDHVLNACLGLVGEAGEVADLAKKEFFHKEKDRMEDFKLELGDVCFYLTKCLDLFGFTLEEVLEANKNKLFARYEVS